MRVAVIGAGIAGLVAAREVAAAGHEVVVFDVVQKAVDALAAAGARVAASPREVAQRVDYVITMLPDSPDVERVFGGPDGVLAGLRPGSVCIDMSTIDPDTTRRIVSVEKPRVAKKRI